MALTKSAQHQGRGLHKDDPERKEIKKALMRGDYGPKMTAAEIRLSKPRYKRKFTGGITFTKSISRLRQEIKEEAKKTKKPNSKKESFKTSPKNRGLRLEDPERKVIKRALIRGDYNSNTTAHEIRHSNRKWQAKFSKNHFARSITLIRQEIALEKSKVATPHKKAQDSSSKSKSTRENKNAATKTPPKKARVSSSSKSKTSTVQKGRSSTRRVTLFKAARQPKTQSAQASAVPTRISRRLASKAPLRIALPKSSTTRSITTVKAKAAAAAATVPSVTSVNATTDQEPSHLVTKKNHLPVREQLSHPTTTQLSLPVWVTPWRTSDKQQILTITLHLLSGTSRDNYVFQVVENGTKLKIRYHSLKEFCDERILVVDASCTEKDANGTPTKCFYDKKHAKVAAMGQQIEQSGALWEMMVALPFAVEQTFYAEPTHVPAAVVFSRINLGDAFNPLTCAIIELRREESSTVVCTTPTWNDVTVVSAAKSRS